MTRRRVAWVLLAVLLGACGRQPRFVPAEADSTAALPVDSTEVYVRLARQGWEDPGRREEAASLVARLVVERLRGHPAEALVPRIRDVIDSLGFVAEVDGRDAVAVANLFARSDPGGGSWPYLFWWGEKGPRSQGLEARGLRLAGVSVEPQERTANPASRVAVLFSRVGAAGPQSFVFVWQRPPGGASWRLVQSLGSDSLGAVGEAVFLDAQPDGAILVSRARVPVPRFDECASCPHVERTRRFRWGSPGLVVAGEEVERSAYFAFVQLVQALSANDRPEALRWVSDPSLVEAGVGYGWNLDKGLWRLAPGSAPQARDLVFFRGAREAYRVHFDRRGEGWVVTGFEPTTRAIE